MLKKITHGIFVVACFNIMALYGAAAESERKVEAAGKKWEPWVYPMPKSGPIYSFQEVEIIGRNLLKEPLCYYAKTFWGRRKYGRGTCIQPGQSFPVKLASNGPYAVQLLWFNRESVVSNTGDIGFSPWSIALGGFTTGPDVLAVIPYIKNLPSQEPTELELSQGKFGEGYRLNKIYIDFIDNPHGGEPSVVPVRGLPPEERAVRAAAKAPAQQVGTIEGDVLRERKLEEEGVIHQSGIRDIIAECLVGQDVAAAAGAGAGN